MGNSKKTSGACLCGSVTVSMDLEKTTFDVCHCGMCRKWGGGPLFTIDAGKNLTFGGKENITAYSSSDWAERGFCKLCGSHIYYHLKNTDFYNFPLGFLNGTEDFKFHLQIFVDHKPHNYEFANKTETMTEAQVMAKYGPPPS